ncbi:FCS-Like Zinc finger 15-like [Macadamia integrifolia]|uniref:FCS-Like Zinc finger 15-like n=1 Tax=Macadamia integrifolia TaxID=60698 RepID=UPI001C4F0705|nr:FCS-Like Zinc finger 15-like [Macadamia integrifolia]
MVGLRILLETQKNINRGPQVINKVTMIKTSFSPTNSSLYSPSTLPAITFLDSCFLCKQRLLPGKDIYMYKGDRAFCSVDCRCRQIFMDEESVRRKNCSSSRSLGVGASSSRHSHRRGIRNQADGFVY